MIRMKNSTFYKFKPVALPIGIIAVVIVLAFVAGNIIIQRIGSIRSEISRLESSNNLLNTRLKTLQEIPVEITESIQIVSRALPPENPAILIAKQIRDIALENDLVIQKMNITRNSAAVSESPDDIANIEINFDATGTLAEIGILIDSLKNISPIVNLSSVELQRKLQDNTVDATLFLTAFSSGFPETLPSITEPISELSQGEMATLEELKVFRQPALGDSQITPVAPDAGRPSPFLLDL